MTSHKHFKHLVRARMAETGETYTVASQRMRDALADVRLNEPTVHQIHGRHGQAVVFTPDSTRLLSGGQDTRIAVLDVRTGELVGELLGHEKVVNDLAVATDGTTVVSASSDRTVRVWDLASSRQTHVLEGHRDAVIAVALAPDGQEAITGGYDGRIRRWNLRDGTCVDEQRSPLKRIAAVVWTTDGTRTLEAGQGPMVVVRDTSGHVTTELDTEAPAVIGLDVAPDGQLLATAGYDGTVKLWHAHTWELIRQLRVSDRANAVAFSRGGHLLAAAAAGRIALWSHRDDQQAATYKLPIKGVYALAFSPDTRHLAQTGADGKVRIWTLR